MFLQSQLFGGLLRGVFPQARHTLDNLRRRYIDWQKTGRNLEELRLRNADLRRNVCGVLRRDSGECSGECEGCRYEIDNHISRKELAEVFNVSENVVFNWETGRSNVQYDDLLYYAQLSNRKVDEIVAFEE